MLQQTRVETVERYFTGFMERFPTVDALASASEDAVLSAWSGLGYYRRARLLHAGARFVAQQLAGELPNRVDALREVPGIGPYTAGAIASIAYGEAEPLVDGNIARVLSRVRGVDEVVEQGASAKGHWALTRSILERGDPRVLAQALMELGATVCTPATPSCDRCPISELCVARREGKQQLIPAPRARSVAATECFVAILVHSDRGLLLERRPADGLLAGMWTPPLVAVPRIEHDSNLRAARQVAGTLLPRELKSRTRMARILTDQDDAPRVVQHIFTHRRWQLAMLTMRVAADDAGVISPDSAHRWWNGTQRDHSLGGIPTLTRKLAQASSTVPKLASQRRRRGS